jgi:hypothetical protein
MGEDADRWTTATGGPTTGASTGHRYVETLAGTGDAGAVVLVGVVHDHPASVARVHRVVEATQPDVLALELPPLAVPLYEAHAAEGETPPALGGEFSAAVQAASTDDVVGIVRPSVGFTRTFLRRLSRERAAPGVAGSPTRSARRTWPSTTTDRRRPEPYTTSSLRKSETPLYIRQPMQ